MASEIKERNALAELADRLDTGKSTEFIPHVDGYDLNLARRIIAELAKVRWWRSMSGWMPRGSDVSKILVTCRAIAEE